MAIPQPALLLPSIPSFTSSPALRFSSTWIFYSKYFYGAYHCYFWGFKWKLDFFKLWKPKVFQHSLSFKRHFNGFSFKSLKLQYYPLYWSNWLKLLSFDKLIYLVCSFDDFLGSVIKCIRESIVHVVQHVRCIDVNSTDTFINLNIGQWHSRVWVTF